MILRHAVGKSTLTEGFAVPRHLETWIDAPPKGKKRRITLVFDGMEATVILRRLANSYGHVQVRYDTKGSSPFKEWLSRTFKATSRSVCGEYIELSKCGTDRYRVDAFAVSGDRRASLAVAEWLFHRCREQLVDECSPLREIVAIVRSVDFADGEGQSHYNSSLSKGFASWGWVAESRVIPDLPLKCDFLKEGVQVEVEFGNARAYYQDYVKFMLAYKQRIANVGVLIVPAEPLARALCNVGRQRALEKGRHSYSGMIHLEKVRREFKHLEFMLQMPIVIAGLNVAPAGIEGHT